MEESPNVGMSQPVIDTDNREKFITEMKNFIEKECLEIGETLTHLSWTPDYILKGSSKVKCPHDSNHLVSESSLEKHAATCRLRKLGLTQEEIELQLQNSDFFYENASSVGKVELDEGHLNRILWNHSMQNRQVHMGHHSMPVSADDCAAKLSPQERLAVYDYCVEKLKAEGKMASVEKDEVLTTDWERIIKKDLLEQGGEKPKSKMELLAMLRDQKRRRQSYRAKNVHITRKSYTEIIREVILNQIEIMLPSGSSSDKEQTSRREDSAEVGSHCSSPSFSKEVSRHRSKSRSPRRHHFRRSRSPSQHKKNSRSRSPRRKRSQSRSPKRKKYRSPSPRRQQSRSCSPRRKKHRSRSPRRKISREKSRSHSPSRKTSMHMGRTSASGNMDMDGKNPSKGSAFHEETDKAVGKKKENYTHKDQKNEEEEGEVESDEEESFVNRHRTPKRKKSKSKKHKHKNKKQKNRSSRDSSAERY